MFSFVFTLVSRTECLFNICLIEYKNSVVGISIFSSAFFCIK